MRRISLLTTLALSAAALTAGTGFSPSATPTWQPGDTGVTARLRGLSPIDDQVAWASGSGSTVLRTLDGGRSWQRVGPATDVPLQFRDIEAFDADRAVALSIGPGGDSRVYRTDNGGRTWTETFRNDDERAFYDCMAFFDSQHGLALSDPVDGRFRLVTTADGGRTWTLAPTDGMPEALPGEFAFAASGSCLVTAAGAPDRAWIATGGGDRARVFRTDDRGRSWQVSDTPVPGGASAGIYSLAFHDPEHGVALGGDYATPTSAPDGAATSRDGGRNWTVADHQPGEYRSGSAWLGGRTVLAVGPTGSDISRDGGRTWARFDSGSFDTVGCTRTGACWASGEQGRTARLTWR